MTAKELYPIGKQDAVCEIFRMVRTNGERSALREIALQVVRVGGDNPNPHAVHYLKTHSEL